MSSPVSMETCTSYSLLPPQSPFPASKHLIDPPNFAPKPRFRYVHLRITSLPPATALKTPKGFDPQPNKKKTKKRKSTRKDPIEEDDDDDDDDEENVVPEIVTNRMMSRIAVSVGTPLLIGVTFFVVFYYLKTGLKVDVPTWIPLLVSFGFYGIALLGVSYGIVSSSWDPLREGSFLGWNEAQKNWPVFLQSFRRGSNKK